MLTLLRCTLLLSVGCYALWDGYIDAKNERELYEEEIGATVDSLKRDENIFLALAIIWTIFTVSGWKGVYIGLSPEPSTFVKWT